MSRDEKPSENSGFRPTLPDRLETLRYIYPWFEVVFWVGKASSGSTQESSRDEIGAQGASMGLTFWPKGEK